MCSLASNGFNFGVVLACINVLDVQYYINIVNGHVLLLRPKATIVAFDSI